MNGSTATGANNSTAPPALDPYADDDEDQLRSIAKKLEEKYVIKINGLNWMN